MIGGSLGAILRYLLGLFMMKKYSNPPFPLAMLVVNILGSAGLGAFYGYYYNAMPPTTAYSDSLFLTIAIGFFGAFTTFSTFSVEAMMLLQRQSYKALSIYIGLSFIGSIGFFLLFFLGAQAISF